MSFRIGESGANKILRVAAGFDMSSNTELTLDFTLPDGTTTTKVKADGVSLGTSPVTDPDVGLLAANEYVEFPISVGFHSQEGGWNVYLTYTNDASTPDDVFIGLCAEYTVLGVDCS